MVKFIAEVCSNHNGELKRALALIDAAKRVGCWGVKFQLFRVDSLFAPELLSSPKFSHVNERRRWELPLEWLPIIKERCNQHGLKFGCTPFYLDAVADLKPYVDFYKIASYELPWGDLLERILITTDKPVMMSCGMATLDEIKAAVYSQAVAYWGWETETRLTLLHCISEYENLLPENCYLSFIGKLRTQISAITRVGYSDHSVNPGVIYRAVHRYGAQIVEFHLDLDDGLGDESNLGHCWPESEIAGVIQTVKDGIAADGDITKFDPTTNPDRHFRADPEDGLRPMKYMRGRLGGN